MSKQLKISRDLLLKNKYRMVLIVLTAIIFQRIFTYSSRIGILMHTISKSTQGIAEGATILSILSNIEIFSWTLILNWESIAVASAALGMILALYSIVKNRVTYLMASITLVYGTYIIVLWILYSTYLYRTHYLGIIELIELLSLELAITAIILSILEFMKPILAYKNVSSLRRGSRIISIIDILTYVAIIGGSSIILVIFTEYIVKSIGEVSKYAAPELRAFISIYLESYIGHIIVFIMALGIITYFLYNLVEPVMIYLTGSVYQAREIMRSEYIKSIDKEKGKAFNINKYLAIGSVAILLLSFIVVVILIRSPDYLMGTVLEAIRNILTIRWEARPSSIDYYLNEILDPKNINVWKERIEALIRFIMHLLF